MILERGDWESLEGKALVYATGDVDGVAESLGMPKSGNPDLVLVFFITGDILDLKTTGSLPGAYGEMLREVLNHPSFQGLEQSLSEAEYPAFGVYFPSAKDDIPEIGDLIYAGEYSSSTRMLDALRAVANYYQVKFEEQLLIDKNSSEFDKGDLPVDNFESVPTEGFVEYIRREYIIPMMDAVSQGRKLDVASARKKFGGFGFGSPVRRDISVLCNLIESRDPNLELIDLHISKLDAVKRKEYIEAAVIRDKIIGIL